MANSNGLRFSGMNHTYNLVFGPIFKRETFFSMSYELFSDALQRQFRHIFFNEKLFFLTRHNLKKNYSIFKKMGQTLDLL